MKSEDSTALSRATAGREEWPDGTYGGSRRQHPLLLPGEPDPDAAEHVQELTEALADWRLGDRAKRAEWRPA
ncbi:hypothetical protein ACFV6Z_18565 [Streptomyces sp. NPDC059818]|uniref:hypothetical protein n=1 Tax=Streptomyces sp. NPDC059818 TaxID=3346962 RepID=UPI003649351C